MRSFRDSYLIIVCIAGSLFTAGHLTYSIYIAMKRQRLAYSGDVAAAKRIILPCFKPLVRGLLLFHLLFAAALALTFINSRVVVRRIIEYYCFSLLTTYCITPVMLTQTSVTSATFRRTVQTMVPYWLLSTLFFGLTGIGGDVGVVFNACFVLSAALPPLFLSTAILTKRVYSRVQIGSNSNRNATEILLVYSIVFGVLFMLAVATPNQGPIIDAIAVATTLILNQLFPFALYRTLLADTKFWRGLGKHNQGGLRLANDLAARTTLARPTMEFNIASTTLQSVMAENYDIVIDFAFLALEREIGQGATSRVFQGSFKKKQVVAVKLSSPPEIQEAELEIFINEARISSLFKHVNVVRFLGICVRPPQIGMCFEFCEGGGLKQNLAANPTLWSAAARLKACLHAVRGVGYLHSLGYMHRDVKPDNFFVGRRQVVKLGDFGEATRIPHRSPSLANEMLIQQQQQNNEDDQDNSNSSSFSLVNRISFSSRSNYNNHENNENNSHHNEEKERMTILGTVAFMAPELVDNHPRYDEKIDIYALAVTMWEILTGQEPYLSLSTFQIYDLVRQGQRPEINEESVIPPSVQEIIQLAWQNEAQDRPTTSQLEALIEVQLRQLHGLGDSSRSRVTSRVVSDNSQSQQQEKTATAVTRPNSYRSSGGDEEKEKNNDENHDHEEEDGNEVRPSAIIRPVEQPALNPLLSRGLAAIRSSVTRFQQQRASSKANSASTISSSGDNKRSGGATLSSNKHHIADNNAVSNPISSTLTLSSEEATAATTATMAVEEHELKEQPRPRDLSSSPPVSSSHNSGSSTDDG